MQNNKKWWVNSSLVITIILITGIILRVVVYWQNRSLFIDESNLALNIIEKSGWEYFQSLDYEQYCPPIFLLLTKACIHLGGINEWALKIIPLISGFFILILMYKLLEQWITIASAKWYVLGLASCSTLLIRYSTEVKQYSTDAAIGLGLIWWALQYKDKKWNALDYFKWTLVGTLAIWTSMPSIFILAAIGFSFLYQDWQRQQISWILFLVGAVWLGNFAWYFTTVLQQDASSDYLQNFHNTYFFDLLPTDWDRLLLDWNLLVGIISSVTDHTALGIGLGLMLLLLGSIQIIRKSKEDAILILAPVLLCLIASHLGLYSLIKRLTVFFIPLLMLLVGIGLQTTWPRENRWMQLVFGILLTISIINKRGYQYLWFKMEFEDSKSTLAYLSQQHKGSPIFVQADAVPAFRFYNDYHDNAYHLAPVVLAKWNQFPQANLLDNPRQEFWLFFSHTFPKRKEKYLTRSKKIAAPIQDYQTAAASVYLFQKK